MSTDSDKHTEIQVNLGKMDKRIRPFEDIAPTNVRKLLFCLFSRSTDGPSRTDLFLKWTLDFRYRKINIKKV